MKLAKTGEVNSDCEGCPNAVVLPEGEPDPMMFCVKYMDFPIKQETYVEIDKSKLKNKLNPKYRNSRERKITCDKETRENPELLV